MDAAIVDDGSSFKHFSKIPRFRTLEAVITEKLDGTNAQVLVPEDPEGEILAGSRNRWVTPKSDNFGFAAFVHANKDALRALGPGRHYGEWWGSGIQRGYGLTERRFWLFSLGRFPGGLPRITLDALGDKIGLVPLLYQGAVDSTAIATTIEKLFADGSRAVPGWKHPEGVVINLGGQRWKVTDGGDAHKGSGNNDGLVHE